MVNRIGNIASNALNEIQSGFKSLFSRSVQDQGAMVSPKMTASNSSATAKTGSASSLVSPSTNSMGKNAEATLRQTFSEIAQSDKSAQIQKLPIESFTEDQKQIMSIINRTIGRGLVMDKYNAKNDLPNNALKNASKELNEYYETVNNRTGMTKADFLNLCNQAMLHYQMDDKANSVINNFSKLANN